MKSNIEIHPLSSSTLNTVEDVISDSILALRQRELLAFAVDRNSPIGIRLALVRGEFQRLLAGECVRTDVIERAAGWQ